MALKNKTHDVDRVAVVRRKPKQIVRTQNEHELSTHPTAALERTVAKPPAALRPADILKLQRTIGNRAVQRLLDGPIQKTHPCTSSGPIIQAKLTIGPAGDKYEQEADRIARQVMSMDAQPAGPSIQRATEKEEEELQRKPNVSISPLVQRQFIDEEELQTNSLQHEESGELKTTVPGIEAAIQQSRGSGQSLPDSVRTRMEGAFGADFSGVRVHTDAAADDLNRSLQARAFTNRQDLFFKQGEYNPTSQSGQELIAHELTHVIQQGGSRTQQSAGNSIAPLHSRITSSISSGIQSTHARLQMKKNYEVLDDQLAGGGYCGLK